MGCLLRRLYSSLIALPVSRGIRSPHLSGPGDQLIDTLDNNMPFEMIPRNRNRSRNRKLQMSRAPTKAKSWEPAYSQALNQNKIIRQRSRSRESGRQAVRRLWWMVFGVETGREVRGRR